VCACMRACVRACMRACVRACVCVCCVDMQTVPCLRFMPVMCRHQLAICESEKRAASVRWKPLLAGIALTLQTNLLPAQGAPGNYSRALPCCRLKQVVDST